MAGFANRPRSIHPDERVMRTVSPMISALSTFCALPLLAQSVIPVRSIGEMVAVSADSIVLPAAVRGLSNGNVIVNEVRRSRILLFEKNLSSMRSVEGIISTQASLISHLGDSTLVPDWPSRSLLVLGPLGDVARTMALPSASITPANFAVQSGQLPVIDQKGRLIYQGFFPSKPGPSEFGPAIAARAAVVPDSAPILRIDFETRLADTLGVIYTPAITPVKSVSQTRNGNFILHLSFNPLPRASDAWALLSDGSVAFVRGHDYHIDWVDTTSVVRSTPKMPISWRPQTDADKLKVQRDWQPRIAALNLKYVNESTDRPVLAGAPQILSQIEMVPPSEYADFVTPFVPYSVVADRENRLWIPARNSTSAVDGLLYDIINREGMIVERVRLPVGRVVVGFTSPDVVVMTHTAKDRTVIELARVR